jgi:hypothetical protein
MWSASLLRRNLNQILIKPKSGPPEEIGITISAQMECSTILLLYTNFILPSHFLNKFVLSSNQAWTGRYMREIDLTELLPEVVLKSQREQKGIAIPVFLTIPPGLPAFPWSDNSLEMLIFKLFDRAISATDGGRPVRAAVSKKLRMSDIEVLLNLHPSHWIQLRIDLQSRSGLEASIQEEFEKSGYCPEDEWATEKMVGRLIAYSRMNQPESRLLLWIERRKANQRYAFLIPIDKTAARKEKFGH